MFHTTEKGDGPAEGGGEKRHDAGAEGGGETRGNDEKNGEEQNPATNPAKSCEFLDCKNRVILPGLHNSHCHAYGLAHMSKVADLHKANSVEKMQTALLEKLKNIKNKADLFYLEGAQWDQELLGRMPNKEDISGIGGLPGDDGDDTNGAGKRAEETEDGQESENGNFDDDLSPGGSSVAIPTTTAEIAGGLQSSAGGGAGTSSS